MSSTANKSILIARKAGLLYVADYDKGFQRVGARKPFRYLSLRGKPIRNARVLARIEALVIPPAWTKVWICRQAHGHIQAIGRDARGRKQYLYHAKWRQVRDESKYHHMISFAQSLQKIRRRVKHDLRLAGLPRDKVIATVVRLLQTSVMRIGNDEYARENKSFGLTTLKNRHVKVKGAAVHFEFRGKSGVEHAIDLEDPGLARIIKRCQDLPGQELFQYVDEDGKRHRIQSDAVNAYLHETAGDEFTAKDFRTWAGTVLAAVGLGKLGAFESESGAKRNIVEVIGAVAKMLGNTKSVCRKCYIHPGIFEAYTAGAFDALMSLNPQKPLKHSSIRLSLAEAAVLRMLKKGGAR